MAFQALYMRTVNTVRASKRLSEIFQSLLEKAYYSWNVFLGGLDIPCESWKIFMYFFVCLFLYREAWTKRQSALAVYLMRVLLFTSRLFVQKQHKKRREIVLEKKKKKWKIWQRENIHHPIYQCKNIERIFHLQINLTHDTWTVWQQSVFLNIRFIDHMSKQMFVKVLILSPSII